jgi:aldose 1-epimerase
MFEILQKPFGSYEKYLLKSATSEVAFVPAFGANILSLKFNHTEILWGFENEVQLIANDKSRSIHLAPFPNRIQDGKYFFEGNYYQLPINKPKENNAIHGFVWNKKFEVINSNAEKDFASVTLKYIYDGGEAGYPFPFELLFEYTLKENSFSLNFSAVNTGSNNMPFGYGWHPYFTFGNNVEHLQLQLPECNVLETDIRLIPTGNSKNYNSFQQPENIDITEFDTAFELTGNKDFFETKLFSAETNKTISIQQSNVFKYLQVYIPPNRHCIAIEPMTCPANAFNSEEGLIVLQPKQNYSGIITVSILNN